MLGGVLLWSVYAVSFYIWGKQESLSAIESDLQKGG